MISFGCQKLARTIAEVSRRPKWTISFGCQKVARTIAEVSRSQQNPILCHGGKMFWKYCLLLGWQNPINNFKRAQSNFWKSIWISGNRKVVKKKKTTINILTRARRSVSASRGTRAKSIEPLSSTYKKLVAVFLIRTLPHCPDRTFIKRRPRVNFHFSPTLGGDMFTSVCLQDKNSGATESGRPLLPF
jgi:hypothetical protein